MSDKDYSGVLAAFLTAGIFAGAMYWSRVSNPPLEKITTKEGNWYQINIKEYNMQHKYVVYSEDYRTFQLKVRNIENEKKTRITQRELADLCLELDKNGDCILSEEELK